METTRVESRAIREFPLVALTDQGPVLDLVKSTFAGQQIWPDSTLTVLDTRPHPFGDAEPCLVFAYQGHSMSGTFQAGDLLWVGRADRGSIRPGDVIAFYKTESSGAVKYVAHRVRRGTQGGFISQGDANSLPDPLPVTFEDIIGRVEFAARDGRMRRVFGGLAGQAWAVHLSLRRKIRQLGRWPYRLLKKSGLVRCLWRPRIEQIHIASTEGNWVKYLHGQRIVARWSAESKQFWCCKPYDLVIDHPEKEPP